MISSGTNRRKIGCTKLDIAVYIFVVSSIDDYDICTVCLIYTNDAAFIIVFGFAVERNITISAGFANPLEVTAGDFAIASISGCILHITVVACKVTRNSSCIAAVCCIIHIADDLICSIPFTVDTFGNRCIIHAAGRIVFHNCIVQTCTGSRISTFTTLTGKLT